MSLKEFDPIITTTPLVGEDVLDPSLRHSIPVGHPGIIVDVLSPGKAYEVDFTLGKRGPDGIIDDPQYCQLTLAPEQIRLDPASAPGRAGASSPAR
jgi:hypothetical protein